MTLQRTGFLFFVIALIVVFVFPAMASAQGFFEGPIVPCGGEEGPPCQVCHLVLLGQNLMNFGITLATVIAVLLFVYAGVKYITAGGNSSQISQATSIFFNVLVGFVLLLIAWLIVDTIMGALLNKEWGPWNEIECVAQESEGNTNYGTYQPPLGSMPGGIIPSTPVRTGQVTHEEGTATLASAGVDVKPGASLQGVREATVEQVVNIKEACPTCSVVVTSGTDGIHAPGEFSHGTGYKVDLRATNELDTFFESNLRSAGTRTGSHGGARYYDNCGNEYVREDTHWDIKVAGGACTL